MRVARRQGQLVICGQAAAKTGRKLGLEGTDAARRAGQRMPGENHSDGLGQLHCG